MKKGLRERMINEQPEKLEEWQQRMQSQAKGEESIRKLEVPNRVNHSKEDRIRTEKCHWIWLQSKKSNV